MSKERLSRRDFIKGSGLALASFVLSPERSKKEFPLVISHLQTDLPLYALTIDDCWMPEVLVEMLDYLRENRFQATFFPIATAALACNEISPDIFKRVAEEGHTIGYHTMNHPAKERVLQTSYEEWNADYDNWTRNFRWLLGQDYYSLAVKRYARAPYGEFTESFLGMCENKGLTPYFWSADSGSLENNIPLSRGNILLLHVTDRDLGLMRDELSLASRDLRAASISCIEDENYCPAAYPLDGDLRRRKNFSTNIRGT